MASSLPAALDLDGVAVITGGASGFGLELAMRLHGKIYGLALLDISSPELTVAARALEAKTCTERSTRVIALNCDVTSTPSCMAAYQAVCKSFPESGVSLLFNNAGILGNAGHGSILEGPATEQTWSELFSVNVYGAVNVLRAFVPGMIADGPPSSGESYVPCMPDW